MGNTDEQSISYKINEIFYSIQAEGFWAGRPAVFIRFSACNLRCDFCDTEFLSGIEMNVDDILAEITGEPANFVVLTGGEPLLCNTEPLVKALKDSGYTVAVETNGTMLPKHDLFDWITVSPKNDKIKIRRCNEVKVVLGKNEIPDDKDIEADHYFISPKNPTHHEKIGTATANEFDRDTARYCYNYVLKNPKWRLTLQQHKVLEVK